MVKDENEDGILLIGPERVIEKPKFAPPRLNYFWGIDVAENLNFFAVWVLYIMDGHIRVKTVKKAKNVLYPTLEKMLTGPGGLSKKYPPKEIWTDYTSEKSFSEWLEAKFHPAFSNPHSKQYKKWRTVFPMVSTQPSNLTMKQNASHLMQPDQNGDSIFQWPDPKKSHPSTAALCAEAKEQMLRESSHSMMSGAGMTKPVFPKPIGYDNDLIRSLELALMGARKHVTGMSNLSGKIIVHGAKLDPPNWRSEKDGFIRDMMKRTSNLNVTDAHFHFSN